jgi:hypothetical protein
MASPPEITAAWAATLASSPRRRAITTGLLFHREEIMNSIQGTST